MKNFTNWLKRRGCTYSVILHDKKRTDMIILFMEFSLKDFCLRPKIVFLDKDTIAIKWLFIYFGFIQKNNKDRWYYVLKTKNKQREDWHLYGEK